MLILKKLSIILIGFGVLSVVSQEAAAKKQFEIQSLMTSDFMGVQVSYLESKIGPAMQVTPQYDIQPEKRSYKAQGCPIVAYVMDKAVVGYEVTRSKTCFVDVSELANLPGVKGASTFGQFDQGTDGEGVYRADCLSQCGNSMDPNFYWYWEGPHSSNFMNIKLTLVLASSKSLQAADQWQSAMAQEGDDYIVNGRFNCDEKYKKSAASAFRNLQFDRIYIGRYNPLEVDSQPWSCTTQ